jgi:hypothetical protein
MVLKYVKNWNINVPFIWEQQTVPKSEQMYGVLRGQANLQLIVRLQMSVKQWCNDD